MRTRLPSRAKIGAARLCMSKAIVAVMLLAALMACGGRSGPDTVAVPAAQDETATSTPAAPTPLPSRPRHRAPSCLPPPPPPKSH